MHEEQHSLGTIVRRTAAPFFLFTFVLAVMLLLSWYVLIPKLTQVEVAGAERNIDQIRTYTQNLEAQLITLEQRRKAFILPIQNPLYKRIRSLKERRLVYQDIRRDLQKVRKDTMPDVPNAIVFRGFHYDAFNKTVDVRGTVQNVGVRSMTVLAYFLEKVRELESVKDVKHSRFVRYEDEPGVYTSPFTFRVILHDE